MPTKIFLVQGDNRSKGIKQLLEQFNLNNLSGKHVAVKANYNSVDPYPAQTHIDTLEALIRGIQNTGASQITMGERSGMGNTSMVLEESGVYKLSKKLGFSVEVLNELPISGWLHCDVENSHWHRGFLIARLFKEADMVVQTCCLKTHRFGGHFTLSLKNSVGMIARYNPQDGYDYMGELHGSKYQRHMIAEINTAYEPHLILMDGIKAFVKGGPAHGEEVTPNILLAGTDRIAMDAIGLAILRHYGTTPEATKGSIFDQTQLNRAIELGLGIQSFKEIKLNPLDSKSKTLVQEISSQF